MKYKELRETVGLARAELRRLREANDKERIRRERLEREVDFWRKPQLAFQVPISLTEARRMSPERLQTLLNVRAEQAFADLFSKSLKGEINGLHVEITSRVDGLETIHTYRVTVPTKKD